MWSSSHRERRWTEQRETEREESKNDRDKACEDEAFTVKRCLWRKITINLVKGWSENTPALPDCRADSITFLLIFSLSLSESTAFSKSSPDFQLLSVVVVPDKQNLLDQADFTAAPAHMAASVAHSELKGDFFSSPHSRLFEIHFSPNSHSVFTPTNISNLIVFIFQRLSTSLGNQMKTQECIELELLLDGHLWESQTQLWH